VHRLSNIVQCQVNAGLGNQLFQACAAISYGLKHQRQIVLDRSWYRLQRYRPKRLFLLEKLLPFGDKVSDNNIISLVYQNISWEGLLAALVRNRRQVREWLPSLAGRRFIFEESIHERPKELSIEYPERRIVMLGSWQTVDHFRQVGPVFREVIKPRFEQSISGRGFLSMIRKANVPVSVHVRRGDFLSIGHGVHTPRFYRDAAELIRGRLGTEPDWFVFSEDQEWCRTYLRFLGKRVHFVAVESPHAEVEELLLMKECRAGAIIANSSFSWWGAALGDRPGRPVVASRYRHGPGKGDVQGERLLPHWETVEEF
jgi:hypothetical protein